MGRWEPDTPGRLQQAAFDLYAEHGYARTTVADIAARAGLTERTFFRHFADKREVFFAGGDRFVEVVVHAATTAPATATAMGAVVRAIGGAGELYAALEPARRRQALLLANPELQERELAKLAALTAALGGALRGRGVPATTAHLAAETGAAVLRTAYARWLEDPDQQVWSTHVAVTVRELRALTTAPDADARS